MPVKSDREYRKIPAFLVETRAAGEDGQEQAEECRVGGYATTYNDPYVLGSLDGVDYLEQIDRHALDEADLSDVIMQYDHEGRVLARLSNGTLQIIPDDDHGIKVEADLSKTDAARALYEDIRTGMVKDMSWAFTVQEDAYDIETHTRTILKVAKVYDVSAVSIPANPQTEISARAYCAERAREAADREAAELAAKNEERKAECLRILGETTTKIQEVKSHE